jgi:hypothetical protein
MSDCVASLAMTDSDLTSRTSEARSGTPNHECACCAELELQFCLHQTSVAMGPRFRGDDEGAGYPSNTASAPFTASAPSITVRSSEAACTEMFSAKNLASVT